jgi:hypothetical protein
MSPILGRITDKPQYCQDETEPFARLIRQRGNGEWLMLLRYRLGFSLRPNDFVIMGAGVALAALVAFSF